jgi:TRAP transporter 4TM/12TM fusion protein
VSTLETRNTDSTAIQSIRSLLGFALLAFQLLIIVNPQLPMVERPLHLVMATALAFLWSPLPRQCGFRGMFYRVLDVFILAGIAAVTVYYLIFTTRLTERMEMVDPIYVHDIFFGILFTVILLEGVRRTVGWSLLGVLLTFLSYAWLGPWMPGWLNFSGFRLDAVVEMLTMSLNGILGITTETSVQFVFYFVMFGAIYSAVGGGQLFIDIGLKLSGRFQGGAAKAAVISSSLMGTISGSAVANVAATGVFTIPLMRKAGYSAERAAAILAIASTGGQLMPPVMGVAAFVVAEILQVEYLQIAIAGLIPALSFYLALLMTVDLNARKSGIGTMPIVEGAVHVPILPRLYLLLPPLLLVVLLVIGYSATLCAVAATGCSLAVSVFSKDTRMSLKRFITTVAEGTKQASQVAVPIAAIGIIIAIAIQSNLALKFSTKLIGNSSGSSIGAMLLIIVGCIIMGMGLPTVAAYIIGAVLFVPALLELGIAPLSAHFFVMYYCVLSMVTPPVALASYAAAGLANAHTMRTSMLAFRMSFVCFLIPFAFVFDARLLAQGQSWWTIAAFLSMMLATAAWAVALVGYLNRSIGWFVRLLFGGGAAGVILSPTGSMAWWYLLVGLCAVFLVVWLVNRGRPHSPVQAGGSLA